MKKNPTKIWLSVIILIAIFTRFYDLTKVPYCVNWDEASLGYNAYSILKTAKDEYGTFLPLEFKSVGDYKLPFFIYSLVPIVKILGLNAFSVRFLPALSGVICIFLIYEITKLIFNSEKIGLWSAFFLAISPWHIQMTRAGVEIGYATAFTLLGIYGLLLGMLKNPKELYIGVLGFSISFYIYFGERVLLPILLFGSFIFFRQVIFKNIKSFIPTLILGTVLLFPSIILLVTSGQQEKFFKTTIFGFHRTTEYLNQALIEDKSKFVLNIFHNEIYEKSLWIVNNYLNHFSPNFLFTTGPIEDQRSFVHRMGMMYIYDFPLILIGIISLIKNKSKYKYFIVLWLLLAPIPSAITRDYVHARRSLNMVYPLIIIAGMGATKLFETVSTNRNLLKRLFIKGAFAGLFIYSISFYYLSYSVFTPLLTLKGPGGWSCGYKEMISKVNELKDNYKKVVIDTSYQGPYIFFLFFEKYPPYKYQPQAELIQASPDSLGEGRGYDNYEFRGIFWPDDRGSKNTLFVGPPERLPLKDIDPKEAKIVETQRFIDGSVSFLFVETH